MKGFIVAAALVGAALANPMPQAAPAGCQSSKDGSFTIAAVNVTKSAKRDLETRQTNAQLTLKNGVLTDAQGRTGCIVANRQFQFDNPIQSGAIYTNGWSVCANGSLAVAGNAVFYQCLSGNFYNLYDRSQGGQCNAVYIVASGAAAPAPAPGAPVSQISDGQPQASTKVSQISDGQIQAPTGSAKVTQISDGQIQAPTSTAKPITQISDGQIQAPTSTAKPITQISDGQIQAPTSKPASSSARPITQISDGQIQAPTSTRPAVATFTGGAARVGGSFAFVAGIVGAVAML